MSESTPTPIPFTTLHLERIKQDAERGIGASSGDTLLLVRDAALNTAFFEQNKRLIEQVRVLQSDANSWQSGYDEGRRMGTKTALSERNSFSRLAGFWRSPKDMPPEGALVVVLRDAGSVGNGGHAGRRTGRWLELTTAAGAMFLCDAISAGSVIGWVGAEEFQGLEAMRLASYRHQWAGMRGRWLSCHLGKWRAHVDERTVTDWMDSRDEAIDVAIRMEPDDE